MKQSGGSNPPSTFTLSSQIMRIQTPFKFQKFFYFGLDTSARVGDELLAAGIGRFYVGIYPIRRGYDLSVGICDANGCVN